MVEDMYVGVVPLTEDNRESMARFAIVHRLSGTVCPACLHAYSDYDDIMARNPRAGAFLESVCSECWDAYVETLHRFCEEIPRPLESSPKRDEN